MKTTLSIVVPAYNEAGRLSHSVRQILTFMQNMDLAAELIVVDDGSQDNTAILASKTCDEFPALTTKIVRYEENRGKGFAVRTGLLQATGDVAVFSDADLSTPIDEIFRLVEPIYDGQFDVTFGSRALERSLIGTHQSWRREKAGKIFNLIVRWLTGLPFSDTQCGFKAFNMHKFRPLLDVMTIDRFGFDVEFLYAANIRGLRLKEIPVCWNHYEGSKVSFFQDGKRMFNEVRQIRRNSKRGQYSKIEELKFQELVSSNA